MTKSERIQLITKAFDHCIEAHRLLGEAKQDAENTMISIQNEIKKCIAEGKKKDPVSNPTLGSVFIELLEREQEIDSEQDKCGLVNELMDRILNTLLDLEYSLRKDDDPNFAGVIVDE